MTHNELETKEKYNTIDKLLEGDHAFIHVDTRLKGVELPDQLLSKHNVTLKISRQFRGEIKLQKDVIIADLLFPEGYHSCRIPFDAIWGVTDEAGKNMIWPQSTPKEILEEMVTQTEVEQDSTEDEEPETQEESPSICSTKEKEIAAESEPNPKLAKRKIPHLKRVK